ncbi:putative DNA-directed RNA polymerase III RPC4 [Aspergillus undulatus]|uniref:putative DNA-directed RNA polymerase III RPC4 n=1 Tax=Aspergillus undulatus TaxID=1810928 RepID=UPI003CCCBE93
MSRRSKSMTAGPSGGGSASVSSDESDGEIRVSIDRINLESDADDDDDDVVMDLKKKKQRKGKMALGSARESGLRPIRVERHEHEERVVSVNMESSTAKSAELRQQAKGKAKDDDALFVQDDEDTPTEAEPKVKQEPTDDHDQTMADVPHAEEHVTTDDGLLPAPKKKVRRKLSREPSVPAVKDPKSLLRTKEDIEEYDRHAEDLELIKDLFTKEPPTKPTEATEGADTEGADVTADEQEKEKEKTGEGEEAEEEPQDDKLTGQLFLMQFPPITPNLVEQNMDGANASAETTLIPDPAASQGAGQNGAPGQPQNPAFKREDDVEVLDGDEAAAAQTQSKVVTAADWQLKAGQAGKLKVHASGRVTMDWGGISFELDRATAVDFLQEALIVSTPPNVTDEMEGDEHKVWAMGQLSGKFTVTPDWEQIL